MTAATWHVDFCALGDQCVSWHTPDDPSCRPRDTWQPTARHRETDWPGVGTLVSRAEADEDAVGDGDMADARAAVEYGGRDVS